MLKKIDFKYQADLKHLKNRNVVAPIIDKRNTYEVVELISTDDSSAEVEIQFMGLGAELPPGFIEKWNESGWVVLGSLDSQPDIGYGTVSVLDMHPDYYSNKTPKFSKLERND